MKTAIATSLGLLALSIFSGSANAASLNGFDYYATSSANCLSPEGCQTSVAGATTINFNDPGVGAPTTGFAQYSPGGVTQLFTGSQSGKSATPFQDTTRYLTLGTGESTTISLGGLSSYFGLYWGSVDTYNKVEFKKGSELLATFTGADVAKEYTSWVNPNSNVYVDFFSGSAAKYFDTVVLSSSGMAFESDNHAFMAAKPVPVPGLVLGIIAAAGGLALRRNQKNATKA
jgi:hypothetical protein